MTVTEIKHKAPDRTITETVLYPAVRPASDLAGHLDQCLARLTGFSRGWPAVDFLRALAAAMKAGQRQALAEVEHARSLGEVERWQAGQILKLWRRDAPQDALPVLAAVVAEWREEYGDSPEPPPLEQERPLLDRTCTRRRAGNCRLALRLCGPPTDLRHQTADRGWCTWALFSADHPRFGDLSCSSLGKDPGGWPLMARTQLYLVRHGELDRAAGHALGGGLSQLGREQADRLGRRLRTVPFSAIHHSPLARAAQTADIIAGHLPQVPRHACDFIADRTPVPSTGQRDRYPGRWLAWLDGVPDDERDEYATALQAAVGHFGVTGDNDRYELLITHNFVIGWFVRHTLDAPVWRWIGLNQANCAITIVQWDSDRLPTLVSFNDTGHL